MRRQKGDGTFRRDRRRAEGTGDDGRERSSKRRVMPRVLSRCSMHRHTIRPPEDGEAVGQERRSAAVLVEQHPPHFPVVAGEDQARHAAATPEIERCARKLSQGLDEPAGGGLMSRKRAWSQIAEGPGFRKGGLQLVVHRRLV